MVIKDETERYLQSCILHHRPLVDGIFIFDDQSRDLDRGMLKSWGVDHIRVRDRSCPTFTEDESLFREEGWNLFAGAFDLKEGDWVLGLDADEFYVGIPPRALARAGTLMDYQSIEFMIPEIFNLEPMQERTDGYWGAITGVRMTQYRPHDQRFPWGGMGCGVFPAYAHQGRKWSHLLEHGAEILHFGYADEADRKEKYVRYTQNQNNHASRHIQSIMETTNTVPWIGETPEVWRGVR